MKELTDMCELLWICLPYAAMHVCACLFQFFLVCTSFNAGSVSMSNTNIINPISRGVYLGSPAPTQKKGLLCLNLCLKYLIWILKSACLASLPLTSFLLSSFYYYILWIYSNMWDVLWKFFFVSCRQSVWVVLKI